MTRGVQRGGGGIETGHSKAIMLEISRRFHIEQKSAFGRRKGLNFGHIAGTLKQLLVAVFAQKIAIVCKRGKA